MHTHSGTPTAKNVTVLPEFIKMSRPVHLGLTFRGPKCPKIKKEVACFCESINNPLCTYGRNIFQSLMERLRYTHYSVLHLLSCCPLQCDLYYKRCAMVHIYAGRGVRSTVTQIHIVVPAVAARFSRFAFSHL
jgi:hypothetical protein